MVSEPSHKLANALQAIELNIYKNVPVQNGKIKQINTSQLYRWLSNNLRNRMITANSSHVNSHNAKYQMEKNIYNYTKLLNSLDVLHPKKELFLKMVKKKIYNLEIIKYVTCATSFS